MYIDVLSILKRKNMTKSDLAKKMKNNWPSYRTIESFIARGSGGSISVAYAIAEALEVKIDDLIVKDDEERSAHIIKTLGNERDECLSILDRLAYDESEQSNSITAIASRIRNLTTESEGQSHE